MKISDLSRCALSVCASATLLAGCGGSQSPSTGNAWLAPVTTSSILVKSVSSDLAHKSRLFVADQTTSQVLIYPAYVHNPVPIGSISSRVYKPGNLAVDPSGTLYVQNGNNTITEYNRGQKVVSKMLSEPGGSSYTPTTLIVGNDGTVYAGSFNSGKVFEFAAGSTKPTKTLDVRYLEGLALDSKNDLFASWNDDFQCCDGVEKFKPGRKVGKSILGDVGAGELGVDSHDNLLVDEFAFALRGDIAIYKTDSKTPFRKIHVGEKFEFRQLAFDSDETYLYLASCNPGGVYVYDYKTGEPAWTVKKDLLGSCASGVALWPAAPQ